MSEENVSLTKGKNADLRGLIQSYKKQFELTLPKHLTSDRMIRVALTALTKTPALLKCSQASVMSALLDCASMGIEPDGRRAHLIPYGKDCKLIIDYKGLAELVMRSGLVSYITADVVCMNDEYEENLGRVLKHVVNRKEPRGDAYAVYTYVKMKDGSDSFQIMSMEEINAIRDRFAQGTNRSDSPWQTRPLEMAKKTCFRQHCKWLPLSPEIRDAVEKDQDTNLKPRDITSEITVPPEDEDNGPNIDSGKTIDITEQSVDTPANSEAEQREVPEEPEPEPDGGPLASPKRK